MQYAYKRSVCPSPASWTLSLYFPIHVSFPGLEINQNAFWLFCYVSLIHFVTSSMKPMVYEILTSLLHVPRTNIFSINTSLHGAKQLMARRVQFCFSSSMDEACVKCSSDTLSEYKVQENLIQYFPGMSYGQENIENLVNVK